MDHILSAINLVIVTPVSIFVSFLWSPEESDVDYLFLPSFLQPSTAVESSPANSSSSNRKSPITVVSAGSLPSSPDNMAETAGIPVFTLWYLGIAFNYFISPIIERRGRGTYKCKCLREVPTPTTPCTCSELSESNSRELDLPKSEPPAEEPSNGLGLLDIVEAVGEVIVEEAKDVSVKEILDVLNDDAGDEPPTEEASDEE